MLWSLLVNSSRWIGSFGVEFSVGIDVDLVSSTASRLSTDAYGHVCEKDYS
jgi:hypothetical protein